MPTAATAGELTHPLTQRLGIFVVRSEVGDDLLQRGGEFLELFAVEHVFDPRAHLVTQRVDPFAQIIRGGKSVTALVPGLVTHSAVVVHCAFVEHSAVVARCTFIKHRAFIDDIGVTSAMSPAAHVGEFARIDVGAFHRREELSAQRLPCLADEVGQLG